MKNLLFFLLLLPVAAMAQYQNAPNKLRLGIQTTGDGLIFRGDSIPSFTPTSNANAWFFLDTAAQVLYTHIGGTWVSLADTITSGGTVTLSGEVVGASNATKLDTVDRVIFDPTNGGADSTYKLTYNANDFTLHFGMGLGGEVYQMGQELYYPPCINKTASTIYAGQPVMIDTSGIIQGDRLAVMPAFANGLPANYIVGVAAHDISPDAEGLVTWFGYVREVDEADIAASGVTLDVGDILYLSATPGKYSDIEPAAPAINSTIALVVRKPNANNMTLLVRPWLNEKLGELTDVDLSGIADGDALVWDSISGTWQTAPKQDPLTGTGLVKSTGGTISYVTDNSADWNAAYNDRITGAAFTGSTTKTLTLTQQDAGTVTANFTDLQGVTSVATGVGLSGGTITTTGTISADTTVLVSKTFLTNQGYTSNVGTVTSVATGVGLSGGTITSSGTISADTTVLASKTWTQTRGYLTSEVDGSVTNEGSLTVGAGSGTTSVINSNTSGSTGVTISASTGLSISEAGNTITLTNSAPDQTVSLTGAGITSISGTYPSFTITSTEVDGSTSNELQNLTLSGQSLGITSGSGVTLPVVGISAGTGIGVTSSSGTFTITNNSPDQTVSIASGTGITISGSYPNFTVTNASPDQTVSISGAGINAVSGTYPNFTITGTEVDGSVSNEGSLTVGAGASNTSIINSNTSGSTGVTIEASTGLTIAESGSTITLTNSAPDQTVSISGAGINSVSGTYPNFTITGTEVDGSTTNELQNLSLTGQTLGISSGSGVTLPVVGITAGTGISTTSANGDFTITNSAPESTTARNVNATGEGVFRDEVGNELQFKKLVAGSNITLTGADSTVTIAASGGGTGTVTSITAGTGLTGGTITTSGTISADTSVLSTVYALSDTASNLRTVINAKPSGSGAANKIAYWSGSNTLTSDTDLHWDAGNNRLGIGVSSPAYDLSLASGTRTIGMPNVIGTPGGFFTIRSSGAGGGTNLTGGMLILEAGYSTGLSGSEIVFNTAKAGASGSNVRSSTESMRISQEGRLGINTTSPSRLLHVAGEVRITDLTTDTPTRIVGADADGDLGEITTGNGLTITSGALRVDTATIATVSAVRDTASTLRALIPTGGGTVAANKVAFGAASGDTLTSNTNLHWDNTNERLGINNTSPSERLQVGGNVRSERMIINAFSNQTLTFSNHAPALSQGFNLFINSGSANLTASTSDEANQNLAFGTGALSALTTGGKNSAIGNFVLNLLTTGSANTGIGTQALAGLTTGSQNFGIGTGALAAIVNESDNIAIGHTAGFLIRGSSNTLIGSTAGQQITSGSNLTAIGGYAAYNLNGGGLLTSASNGVFIGYGTRASANGNTNEVVLGYEGRGNGSNTTTLGNTSTTGTFLAAGNLNLTGQGATAMQTARHTTAGQPGNNLTIKVGGAASGATDAAGGNLILESGVSTGTGSSNIIFETAAAGSSGTTDRTPAERMRITGSAVGILNTSPDSALTVTGGANFSSTVLAKRLKINTSGQAIEINNYYPSGTNGLNFFIGNGGANMIGSGDSPSRNFGIGNNALLDITSGNNNIAFGDDAGQNITTGVANILIGSNAGENLTGGNGNTVVGINALDASNVNYNTAIGTGVLTTLNSTSIGENTAIGYNSLNPLFSGSKNVALGYDAGRLSNSGSNMTANSNGIFIGHDARSNTTSSSNEVVIGYQGRGNGSNTVTIGNSSTTNNYFNGVIRTTSTIMQTAGVLTVTTASANLNTSPNNTYAYVIVNYAGTCTLTLPTAGNWTGREIKVKTITANIVKSADSNVLPIDDTTASDAILPATDGKWATLVSDGTNWIIMQAN